MLAGATRGEADRVGYAGRVASRIAAIVATISQPYEEKGII